MKGKIRRWDDSTRLVVTEIVQIISDCLIVGTGTLSEWTARRAYESSTTDRISSDDTSLDIELIVRERRRTRFIDIIEIPSSIGSISPS